MTSGVAALLVLAVALTAVSAGVAFYLYYGRLIMRSRVAGIPVAFTRMLRMTTSGLDAQAIVIAYLDGHRAGLTVSLDRLEALSREKIDPRDAVKRFIVEKQSGITAAGDEGGQNTEASH